MISSKQIEDIVELYLNDNPDLFLVSVTVSPDNRIEIIIDSDKPLDLMTCSSLSRFVESKMDRDKEDFELEVASCGLSTPLTMPRQWKKYIDQEVEVLLKTGIKEVGVLKDVDEDEVVIEVVRMMKPEGAKRKKEVPICLSIRYDEIKTATYVVRVKKKK
ncbi:ribosome assembly cofactor RimP [Falsiporphyromonas endometrii]|uniref:Ribosome maturation factor RimP n=1 Tax=Falsiporphyromonas endometrii TaxID=1387297 RepID=A0ABV9K6U4_9PORP